MTPEFLVAIPCTCIIHLLELSLVTMRGYDAIPEVVPQRMPGNQVMEAVAAVMTWFQAPARLDVRSKMPTSTL